MAVLGIISCDLGNSLLHFNINLGLNPRFLAAHYYSGYLRLPVGVVAAAAVSISSLAAISAVFAVFVDSARLTIAAAGLLDNFFTSVLVCIAAFPPMNSKEI